jgi:hypothetical protein
MEKCLYYRRFHYVEGDTDSLYFAISGDKNEDIDQRFKYIIDNEQFLMKTFICGFQITSIHQRSLILYI